MGRRALEAVVGPGGTVVTYAVGREGFLRTHEGQCHAALARLLAELRGSAFGGEFEPGAAYARPLYFVPRDSVDRREAEALGIRSADDLYGGVIPFPFVRTKVITHGLAGRGAPRPEGWSERFGEAVAEAVLPGFSAFSRADAEAAGRRLLELGAVRLKDPLGAGGRGQQVLRSARELARALEALDEAALARHGVVLETNLEEVTTFTVGMVGFGADSLAYHGTQQAALDNRGSEVYGGSTLLVARTPESLARLEVAPSLRRALAQAAAYDRAAAEHYGVVASRRNYDVAEGLDARGVRRSGVLEASWRIGGASGAEVVALQTFRREPAVSLVRVSTHEDYGEGRAPPEGSLVLYRGVDAEQGPMLKYVVRHEAR